MLYVDVKLEDGRFGCSWLDVILVGVVISPKPIFEFSTVHGDLQLDVIRMLRKSLLHTE
jgi:hypothetical protein